MNLHLYKGFIFENTLNIFDRALRFTCQTHQCARPELSNACFVLVRHGCWCEVHRCDIELNCFASLFVLQPLLIVQTWRSILRKRFQQLKMHFGDGDVKKFRLGGGSCSARLVLHRKNRSSLDSRWISAERSTRTRPLELVLGVKGGQICNLNVFVAALNAAG